MHVFPIILLGSRRVNTVFFTKSVIAWQYEGK